MNLAAIGALIFTFFGVAIIGALIYAAMTFRPLPEPWARFARTAVWGACILVVLGAILSAFGMGVPAGTIHITVGGILEFAIGVLVMYLLLYIIDSALVYFQFPMAQQISFVLSVVALIIILGLAAKALTGGLGFINFGDFGNRRTELVPTSQHVGLQQDGGITYLDR
jgi:hypothetical protein